MRCLIETNILIFVALFPDSVPSQAFIKAVAPPHTALISDFCLAEMKRVYERKFPHKLPEFELFLKQILPVIEYVLTPTDPVTSSIKLSKTYVTLTTDLYIERLLLPEQALL